MVYGFSVAGSCGVGLLGSDLTLLWLWHRPVSTALIQPLAWEPPYATDAALESQKKKEINQAKETGQLFQHVT